MHHGVEVSRLDAMDHGAEVLDAGNAHSDVAVAKKKVGATDPGAEVLTQNTATPPAAARRPAAHAGFPRRCRRRCPGHAPAGAQAAPRGCPRLAPRLARPAPRLSPDGSATAPAPALLWSGKIFFF